MIKYLKEYRFYIILFLFILIPLLTIDASNRNPRELRFFDRALLTLTSPLQNLTTFVILNAIEFGEKYVFLRQTDRTNRKLVAEQRKTLQELNALRAERLENERLRSLLKFKEEIKLSTVTGRVVARDVSSEFRSIRVNQGENAGIKKGMAVITSEGVVGRVLRTTPKFSDVVTLLDLLSAVDVQVERSRAQGVLEGMTDEVCQLKFVLRTDDIQVGDRLLSSGLGGVFPKGIPVGLVSRVNKKSYGISQDVEVRPIVDLSKLEEVLIITDQSSEVL